MENNFIQMAASAGHAVAYTFGPIIDYVQLYFANGFVTLIFVKSRAPRWPNDISSAVDNTIFKNRAQNIECSFAC